MTQKNTMQNHKSNLAKLLATENIQVLQNQVKTASFDVKNRVLTIPFFKHNDNNVVDMLIAHEVSHALHTPSDSWQDMKDRSDDFRSFVNVLEDTRIDKLIQKKYPGVTENYIKGFDKLWEDDFFKSKDKNLDDYILIDKINLWYKSSKTLPIKFSKKEQPFIDAIENLKTFDDVLKLAEDILGFCKEEFKNSKEETVKIYRQDPNGEEEINVSDSKDDENKGKEESYQTVDEKTNTWLEKQQPEDKKETEGTNSNGAGGNVDIRSVTNEAFSDPRLTDKTERKRLYGTLPKPNFKKLLVDYKKFILDNQNHFKKECLSEYGHHYVTGLKYAESEFAKFKNKSTPIVNYLVKEFEMRKSARLHARASTDKTGVIDPLKLHTYKFAEDIFKKMTIVPNEKNHGMIFLLDWSGSMANYLMPTVEQLLNLVWFVKKVNIPFSVYAFMNPGDHKYEREISNSFQIKNGDLKVDQSTKLVQLFTHKMSKTDMLLSGKTLYTMAHYYNDRYGYRRGYDDVLDKGYTVSPHIDYHLSSTPLDESLIAMDTIIKQFKDQNKVDKTIFVALTDGGANSVHGVHGNQTSGDLWVKLGKNYVQCESWWRSGKSLTDRLLVYLKKKHNIKTIGFFLVNKFQNLRHHIDSLRESDLLRKAFNKDKVIAYKKSGYDVYYFVKADTNVSDNNLDEITADSKKSEIKKLFAKNMKGRLVSRVVLNKFIREVA